MIVQHGRARRPLAVAAAAAALVALAGCSSTEPPAEPGAATGGSPAPLSAETTLGPPTGPGPGYTYKPADAPEGATVGVEVTGQPGSTAATLRVGGLVPNRGYAVHLHVRPCGPTGDAAGPHFQNRVDPAATPEEPSSDPAYANATNEFWLDVRTDAAGAGTATTTVPFALTDRRPASVIIHEQMETMTAPGKAGTAGGRLACVTLGA